MKALKIILISIISLIGVILIAALFVKKDMSVERSVVINKPKDQVFDYIKYLKNQDNFSKWALMEPTMKKEYKGTDGTVGFVSAWEGDKVGKGEQTIKEIKDGERIDYDLHFIKPMESHNAAYLTTEASGADKTTVKWGYMGQMNYPFNFIRLFVNMEDMIGKDFETGLTNLKNILEKQ